MENEDLDLFNNKFMIRNHKVRNYKDILLVCDKSLVRKLAKSSECSGLFTRLSISQCYKQRIESDTDRLVFLLCGYIEHLELNTTK